jgi:hypothetical protein
MKIREYKDSDLELLRKFHSEAKFDFEFPDPSESQVVIKQCLVDGGKVRMAAFGRLQACAYLLVDGEWKTPEERLEGIKILEFAMIQKAKILGLDQATAQVEPRFGKRLQALGWHQGIGVTFSKEF